LNDETDQDNRFMKIAIVTDSTSDLPADLAEANQIEVVPNLVMIDGKSYKDGVEISRQEFYERLPGMKTATASAGTYHELYERLLQKGAQAILSIHLASTLSGVFSTASSAAQAFGKRVHVLDSQQLSVGLGFQALAAAEAVAQGATLEAVLKLIENMHKRILVMALLDTLEYARRSGRVSWMKAQVGNLLNIKPFLGVRDGEVLRLGEARTRKNGLERLVDFARKLGKLERLAVLHTNAEEEAGRFLEILRPDLAAPAMIVYVTSVIGTHIGPNAVGFGAVALTGQ
jgi:DegV family protein with EDD domain